MIDYTVLSIVTSCSHRQDVVSFSETPQIFGCSLKGEKMGLVVDYPKWEDRKHQMTVTLLDEPFQMKMYSPKLQ